MNMNDRFGVCPECFQEGKLDEEYHYVNVQRVHYMMCERHKMVWCIGMMCERHKMVWCIGSNLFSAWRYENWKLWDENLRMLEKEYKLVESAYPFAPQETNLEGDEPF